MNEETLNASVRRFLKKVGVTSQREIEKAVREAAMRGNLRENELLPATMTLRVAGLELNLKIEGEIECG